MERFGSMMEVAQRYSYQEMCMMVDKYASIVETFIVEGGADAQHIAFYYGLGLNGNFNHKVEVTVGKLGEYVWHPRMGVKHMLCQLLGNVGLTVYVSEAQAYFTVRILADEPSAHALINAVFTDHIVEYQRILTGAYGAFTEQVRHYFFAFDGCELSEAEVRTILRVSYLAPAKWDAKCRENII